MAQLIANLRAREPEMTDTEIMRILNAEENTLDAEKLLRSFGISEDSWTVKSSQADSAAVAAVSVGVCLLCGVACFGVFALYKRRQRKRLDRLVSYLAAVNSGSYDLDLDSNSENAAPCAKRRSKRRRAAKSSKPRCPIFLTSSKRR